MTPFGTTRSGQQVEAITLSAHGLSVTVLTYGAIVQDVRLDGVQHSLTVGSGRLCDYESNMQYFGCVVAPVANRLRDARAVIDGKIHRFDANMDGQHTLHSGSTGAHRFVWQIDEISESGCTLSLKMPDGQGGFPGKREISASFEILPGPALRLTLTTITDAPSIANATNHSYWNLDGSGNFGGHHIKIAADTFLPTNPDTTLVTGAVQPVDRTPFDLRDWTSIAPAKPTFDHTFCVARNRRALTECLWLRGASGLTMTVATTEPGMHIYDGRDSGHNAIAVEAQGWPDAPNNANFPGIEITPDAPAVQTTEWRFSRA